MKTRSRITESGKGRHGRPCNKNAIRSGVAGVGMVEVLVALVVLSVGMLGTASLYVNALKAKTTSQSRMQAINLANDMADRIRANKSGVTSYAIAKGASAAAPSVTCVDSATAAPDVCSADDMAKTDVYLWSAAVTATLPNAARQIVFTAVSATSPPPYAVTLEWSDPASGTLSYSVMVKI